MIQIKDRPQPQLLLDELKTEKFGRKNAFFQEIGSTNSYLKRNAAVLDNGFTAVANLQTGGRGRLGKSFESPSGGLYMSLLVKDLRAEDISSATVKTGVAVCEALEEFLGLEHETLGIKWVNDILYEGKKVCGILCELVRYGNTNCLIVGIGLNILSISRKASAEVRKEPIHLPKSQATEQTRLSDRMCVKSSAQRYLRSLSITFTKIFRRALRPTVSVRLLSEKMFMS